VGLASNDGWARLNLAVGRAHRPHQRGVRDEETDSTTPGIVTRPDGGLWSTGYAT